MNEKKNLLIVGAGIYGIVAKEIAQSMNVFFKISFIDDRAKSTLCEDTVVGTVADLNSLYGEFNSIVVSIGDPEIRFDIINYIKQNTEYEIATLISPNAYVAPSAKIAEGCIIEPMATVHSLCELAEGCIVSAGAVINHGAKCQQCVHVDCNSTIEGFSELPTKIKVKSGSVFKTIH